MQHKEYLLQKQICLYLKIQYPNILFFSDSIAFCKLNIQQAVRNKAIQKEEFKMPDLVILQPIGGYSGLLIELKKESPLLKNGKLSNEKHIQGQFKSINELKSKGYFACFAWSFEMAKEIIDNYLNLK